MPVLTQAQVETFRRDGALVVPGILTREQIDGLRSDFSTWVEDSKKHAEAFGEMMDGRPRFDVEGGHTSSSPGLRRVASPTEISKRYHSAAFDSMLADLTTDLLGSDVRFHHSKINSKLPGTKTVVKWHQDFTFDPHTNDDVLTALVFVDDVTLENGPLMVVPGSHRHALHSLWHDGVFTGAIDDGLAETFATNAVACTGPAGSVCLMHTRLAHASSENRSDRPRTLFIVTYAAADALPLAPNAVPSIHAGTMVRGREPGRVRTIAFEMELPEVPKGASFFVQQAGAD